MTSVLKEYGLEGPLGFPLSDRQAQALEQILKALPKDDAFRYRKALTTKAPCEVLAGERSDVSWISTQNPDRTREVVIAAGMNDSQYKLNPIVTMQHAYYLPPVGKSLWRKAARDGDLRGIKAKTQYPAKPDSWQGTWPADVALSLIQADLLRGKSIGILPTKVHQPNPKELSDQGWADAVDLVIDEWILLEYACTFLPAQQNAVVEAVSKQQLALPENILEALGFDVPTFKAQIAGTMPALLADKGVIKLSHFTPLDEIEKAILRQIQNLDLQGLANQTAQAVLDRARGRV